MDIKMNNDLTEFSFCMNLTNKYIQKLQDYKHKYYPKINNGVVNYWDRTIELKDKDNFKYCNRHGFIDTYINKINSERNKDYYIYSSYRNSVGLRTKN